MVVTAKITSRGRLTLPKEVRAVLNVYAGSVVIFEKVKDKIIIKPVKTLRDYKGVLKNHGRSKRKSILKLEGKVRWEGNLSEMRANSG